MARGDMVSCVACLPASLLHAGHVMRLLACIRGGASCSPPDGQVKFFWSRPSLILSKYISRQIPCCVPRHILDMTSRADLPEPISHQTVRHRTVPCRNAPLISPDLPESPGTPACLIQKRVWKSNRSKSNSIHYPIPGLVLSCPVPDAVQTFKGKKCNHGPVLVGPLRCWWS